MGTPGQLSACGFRGNSAGQLKGSTRTPIAQSCRPLPAQCYVTDGTSFLPQSPEGSGALIKSPPL